MKISIQHLVGAGLVTMILLAGCGGGGGSASSDGGGTGTTDNAGIDTDSTDGAGSDGGTGGDSGGVSAQCAPTTASARYSIAFTGNWTADRHPGNFPAGAHFSPVVGATHKTPDIVWARDGVAIATDGIESMAETGATSVLRDEVEQYIASGGAEQFIPGGGIGNTGSTSVLIDVNEAFPLISLVSMIAPSPDWFVGVRNVDLCEGGDWRDSIDLPLAAIYDAGTDDGATFDSDNVDVTPHLPIRLVADEGNHFLATPLPVATIVISRIP